MVYEKYNPKASPKEKAARRLRVAAAIKADHDRTTQAARAAAANSPYEPQSLGDFMAGKPMVALPLDCRPRSRSDLSTIRPEAARL